MPSDGGGAATVCRMELGRVLVLHSRIGFLPPAALEPLAHYTAGSFPPRRLSTPVSSFHWPKCMQWPPLARSLVWWRRLAGLRFVPCRVGSGSGSVGVHRFACKGPTLL
jgi:hypothetical protein